MVHSWPPGGWGDAGKGGREAWHRQHLDRWLYQLFTACYIGCVISMMMESDNTLRQGFLWVCCISEFGLGRKRQADKRAQQLQIHGSVRAWSWESTCACFVCFFPADMPRSGTLCSIKAMFGLINHDIARRPPPPPSCGGRSVTCPGQLLFTSAVVLWRVFHHHFWDAAFFFFFVSPWDPNDCAVDACTHSEREHTQLVPLFIRETSDWPSIKPPHALSTRAGGKKEESLLPRHP